ncbi:MAG: GNAT family N-acetyltransferase [Chloroflexi bacterium]|nr:GNAT family N-acetyltransferase [Chloroflexota bacterium]
MNNIIVRPLNENDAHAFQELRLKGLSEHPEAFASSYEREIAYTKDFVSNRLRQTAESPNNFTLGAFRERELLGLVGFFRKTGEKEEHRGHIWGMYVRSDEQGKGIGRALLADGVKCARSLPGLEQIELCVVTRNKQARGLYASLGFVSCGIDPRALFVNGEYLDEERMILILN